MAPPSPVASGTVPLRPAMCSSIRDGEDSMSPKSPPKVVSIAEPDNISPLIQPLDGPPSKKQYNAGVAKRLSGRPGNTSRASLQSQRSMEDLPEAALSQSTRSGNPQTQYHHHRSKHEKLLAQVAEWLQAEKAKRASRKAKTLKESTVTLPDESTMITERRSSQDSYSSEVSLEKLQKILEENMHDFFLEPLASPNTVPRRPSYAHMPRRKSSTRALGRPPSSDTEYQDGDVVVPNCDVVLDNSKTLSFSRGAAGSSSDLNIIAMGRKTEKERKAWSTFRSEILRLAHTLRLKGWRRIPLDGGDEIEVERLSGALTNAVYVVYPPKDLRPAPTSNELGLISKKRPPKLLLRIYGPQVEHLIDRENELGILRRLARKKIGPRLLGTFRNGRFEEYFDSTTLTSADLRIPETSKQIAKRMRELHEGIDLLEQEREEGPFVWRNWDKWVDRCELVIKYLDEQILSGKAGPVRSKAEAWKARGLVCGVEWPVFRGVIEKYKKFLEKHCGGAAGVRKQLVFAHNDTQYGNILRLKPSGESPLMLPANSHKQLIVIDFEYASANTPGLEFANHFTEWCYNYHDPVVPYACSTQNYPTKEEQRQFIKSYINHRPQFNPLASATPKATPSQGPGSSISDFLLDSRTPSSGGLATQSNYAEEEAERERQTDQKVKELMEETRLWRVANSAQWVAWGIVQAKVPELDDIATSQASSSPATAVATPATPQSDALSPEQPSEEVKQEADVQLQEQDQRSEKPEVEVIEPGTDADEEFDYLGYAQERAMFFWGDVVSLGLAKAEELSEGVRQSIKIVPY